MCDELEADALSEMLLAMEPEVPLSPDGLELRVAENNDFEAVAITPKKHLAYSKARNDPTLKLGQFPLVLSSVGKYKIQAVDNLTVNYGVGDIGEDESLTAAERADPIRCQIPNTETRVLEVLEPQCNSETNHVLWIVKFPNISSKAIYGPTGGRKLTIRGTVKCLDSTDGSMCLVQVNVATVAIRITIKESEAKGVRKRKYDSAYGPSSVEPMVVSPTRDSEENPREVSESAVVSSRPYQELMVRVTRLESLVAQLSQSRGVVVQI